MRSKVSAGILLYRLTDGSLEVLIGHPGGPFFDHRDEGYWSIPKGEVEADETADLMMVARREFAEETGHQVPDGPLVPLGSVVQKGGKVVHAWAVAGDLDPTASHSNTFELVWPPGSVHTIIVPELDRVAWFDPDEARRRLKASQVPFVDRLGAILDGQGAPGPGSTGAR